MAVMLYAGLRCAEALALKPRDVDMEGYLIRVVRGKGGKDRNVPIEAALEHALRDWRAIRPAGPTFFTTLGGAPLGGRYVREMVGRCARKAGIAERVHPHLLRHTCATYWIGERRLPVHEVQLLLGHARLSSTERYLHAVLPDLVTKMRSWR